MSLRVVVISNFNRLQESRTARHANRHSATMANHEPIRKLGSCTKPNACSNSSSTFTKPKSEQWHVSVAATNFRA